LRRSGKKSTYSAGSEEEPEIGRANLLVSRIMMFAIIDQKNRLFAAVYKKRLTGRFALPKQKEQIYIFLR
jgi:hypothetical protein